MAGPGAHRGAVHRLRGRAPARDSPAPALAKVDAEGLYLACACASGIDEALAAFDRRYASEARAALLSRGEGAAATDDAMQVLRERLFVAATPGGAGKISEYSGRGPLSAWVRMAAVRIALNQRRGRPRDASAEQTRLAQFVSPADDLELGYVKARHSRAFAQAFAEAFSSLSERQRNVLRLHAVEGLGAEKIARAFRVHAASVRRWIADSRQLLLEQTRLHLARQLRLTPSELDSLIGALQSQLDVSIRKLLG